jgi:hypothetical protein
VTLFQSNPQYREKLTIWQVLSLLPLYGTLAEGRIYRWFAVNIPMRINLMTGELFTGDIDIIACLNDFPHSREWIYKTWEVKVSLLYGDGSARSLKAGKVKKQITQLNAYMQFGAPEVTLLDIYICEQGFFKKNLFPSNALIDLIKEKQKELRILGFGYQLLPFELEEKNGEVQRITTIRSSINLKQNTFKVAFTNNFGLRQPFSRLVNDINSFYNQRLSTLSKKRPNQIIVYCKRCQQFQLIDMRKEQNCPNCNDDLVAQT